jgi:UDP-3-O-[3-hydroxymyristoyl] N-acetylglucosamine deacetylase
LRLRRQRTLKNPIRFAGIGVHCERKIELVLKPAGPGTGIVFKRTDGPSPCRSLPALWKNAKASACTSDLEVKGGPRVAGVAQLLSAAAAAGLDNLSVEIEGPEVPILDGSAEPFLFLLCCAGTVEQDELARSLKILKIVEVRDGETYARLEPYDGFAVDLEVDHPHPAVGHQKWSGEITIDRYQSEIARARAFEFRNDQKSASEEPASASVAAEHGLVIGESGVLNAGGFRYPDEPVRHGVLSAIGDLRMAGGPIIGRFSGRGCDHALVLRLLSDLFAMPGAWEWIGDPKGNS